MTSYKASVEANPTYQGITMTIIKWLTKTFINTNPMPYKYLPMPEVMLPRTSKHSPMPKVKPPRTNKYCSTCGSKL